MCAKSHWFQQHVTCVQGDLLPEMVLHITFSALMDLGLWLLHRHLCAWVCKEGWWATIWLWQVQKCFVGRKKKRCKVRAAPTWLESEMQLLLLLICAAGGLTEMTAMCCRGGKVGDGWIRGGVCPKAELRPRCWVKICWYVTGLMGWGKLNAGLQQWEEEKWWGAILNHVYHTG